MIRSRDLIIFVGILLFLGLAIAATVLRDEWGSLHFASVAFTITASTTAPTSYTAESDEKTIDRAQNIARLREALAKDQVLVEPSPSVETPTTTNESASTSQGSSDTGDQIQKCGGEDSAKYIHQWPLSGVTLKEESGSRIVTVEEPALAQTTSVGSSSTSTADMSTQILLEIPLVPTALLKPDCVPSDAIGVTTSGSLIFNSDAVFYRGYGPEFLIGYARDGYPIYGYYQGAIDACGGYQSASGYRYVVSADRNFIVGCFMSVPSSFLGL